MSRFTGTWRMIRFILRRDRVLLPSVILGAGALMLMYVSSVDSLYPTAADLKKLAASMNGNPAVVAMLGPTRNLETLGGVIAWRTGTIMQVTAALISMFLVGRHTRSDEQTGRTELILSTATGRFAPLTAALTVTAAANFLIGLACFGVLISFGLDSGQSLLLAASIAATGLVFTGVSGVAVQLSGQSRGAYGLIGAALAASFVVRATGDLGNGDLTWLSPLGWAELAHAFSGGRWWPLLISLVVAVALVPLAFSLLVRRDLGAGILPPRLGPPRASSLLTTPFGFAFRLQRGTIAGWTIGMVLGGLAIGAVGDSVEQMLKTSTEVERIFTKGGTSNLVDSYLASMLLIFALIGSGYTVSAALRPHSEEKEGRAEQTLATAIGRWRWAGSHALLAFAASVLLLGLCGLSVAIGLGLSTGDWDGTLSLIGSGIANVPAMWVMGGLTILVFGLLPNRIYLAWLALTLAIVIWTADTLSTDAPGWLVEISPFTHTPLLPVASFDAVPLAVMTAIGLGLNAAGLAAFRHRDLT
ncbi:MAG TPA: ABC transporter permease [Solirubrobacterales bacterium]|nr:ABC transporter permease [Solirubrobacterales bacterium]